MIEKENFINDDHLQYLDELREQGVTNMFGAAPYIQDEFPDLSSDEVKKILLYWMKTFSERHPKL